jgi:hypothetical protein
VSKESNVDYNVSKEKPFLTFWLCGMWDIRERRWL